MKPAAVAAVAPADFPQTHAALDDLHRQGRSLRFWLRDDDAVAPTKPLERLLLLVGRHEKPLTLAVIPHHATTALAGRLGEAVRVSVAPHGFAHINHAPSGEKSCEFGANRTAEEVRAEVLAGLGRIRDLFGDRAIPLFVPPWNRMAPDWHAALSDAGYAAMSGFGAKSMADGNGLHALPTHVDIMDWRARTGRAAGEVDADIAGWIARLADDAQPLGLLTHHLAHDETAWAVLDALLELLAGHPAAAWSDIGEVISRLP